MLKGFHNSVLWGIFEPKREALGNGSRELQATESEMRGFISYTGDKTS
jgi:hypothetical protein